MQTVELNNGVKMPILGYGVCRVSDPIEYENIVYEAIKAGYRLLDTTVAYANEEAVGKEYVAVVFPVKSCSSQLNYGFKITVRTSFK